MNHHLPEEQRVLAIDPISRGFGFVVFEGPERLIDWGVTYVQSDKHTKCLERFAKLLKSYDPDVIVVEDTKGESSRRCKRVQLLLAGILKLAKEKGILTQVIAPSFVKQVFAASEAKNKEQIAGILSAKHPELLPHLPPHRKCWMSEDARINIFDSAALAYGFFSTKAKKKDLIV